MIITLMSQSTINPTFITLQYLLFVRISVQYYYWINDLNQSWHNYFQISSLSQQYLNQSWMWSILNCPLRSMSTLPLSAMKSFLRTLTITWSTLRTGQILHLALRYMYINHQKIHIVSRQNTLQIVSWNILNIYIL